MTMRTTNPIGSWPTDRSLPVAGYTPRLALGNLLLGAGLGVGLAVALWWSGHAVSAAVALAATVLAVSAVSHVTMEETWVGDDWLANRFLGRPVVVDIDAVRRIELPSSSVGLSYLLFRGPGRTVRVDLGELFARRTLALTVLELIERAQRSGAEVAPEAAAVLDALRRRLA